VKSAKTIAESRGTKMPQNANLGACCGTPVPGLRRISFPDGDQVGLMGLDEVLDALYREGKQPDDSTAIEIIERLRQNKNYIPYSPSVQDVYQKTLLGEYRRFVEKKKR
jgi:hypothetical protein